MGTLFSALVGPILALYVGFGYFKKKAPKWYDSLVGLINRGNIEKTFKKLNEEGLSDETAKFLIKVLSRDDVKKAIREATKNGAVFDDEHQDKREEMIKSLINEFFKDIKTKDKGDKEIKFSDFHPKF